jgi:hypothetical protein
MRCLLQALLSHLRCRQRTVCLSLRCLLQALLSHLRCRQRTGFFHLRRLLCHIYVVGKVQCFYMCVVFYVVCKEQVLFNTLSATGALVTFALSAKNCFLHLRCLLHVLLSHLRCLQGAVFVFAMSVTRASVIFALSAKKNVFVYICVVCYRRSCHVCVVGK